MLTHNNLSPLHGQLWSKIPLQGCPELGQGGQDFKLTLISHWMWATPGKVATLGRLPVAQAVIP